VRDTGWTGRVRYLNTPVSRRELYGVVCDERRPAQPHNAVGWTPGELVRWIAAMLHPSGQSNICSSREMVGVWLDGDPTCDPTGS